MQSFAYTAPRTLDEALTVLQTHHRNGQRAQVLAGGTDLLVQMRSVDKTPRTIVDIKKLSETNRLDVAAKETFIGAAIPAAKLTGNADLVRRYPGLIEALDLIGSSQIQGRATLGGNLCNASPAGDTIPALIATGAVCVIAGASGTREVPAEKFVVGVGKNALNPGELLLGFKIPVPAPRTADAYLRFIPRTEMDIAVVGAGVSVTVDPSGTCLAARVAIGAVAPTVLLVDNAANAIVRTKLDVRALDALARACSDASSPITDKRGTIEYRKKVVGVLAKRAAAIAAQRAKAREESR